MESASGTWVLAMDRRGYGSSFGLSFCLAVFRSLAMSWDCFQDASTVGIEGRRGWRVRGSIPMGIQVLTAFHGTSEAEISY